MRELHKVEYEKHLNAYNNASEEQRKTMSYSLTPPKDKWDEIYNMLSGYHIYLERQYGGGTGSMYCLKIHNQPLEPRGVFSCEYVQDFGSITDFFEDYYGLTRHQLSRFHIWKKYHKLAKVEYYSPAELADKLVQLSRELLYRYRTAQYLNNPNYDIRCYEVDFEWNHLDVSLRCRSQEHDYEYISIARVA